MSKAEFMKELEALLMDVSYEERVEALKFYEDYFEDAGTLDEEQVVKNLGTPEDIAKMIKVNLYEKDAYQKVEYTDTGYHDPNYEGSYKVSNGEMGADGRSSGSRDFLENIKEFKNQNKNNNVILIILLILASPILIGLAGGVFGLGIGLLGGLIGIVFGFGGATIGLLIGGAASFGVGVARIVFSPASGIMGIGVGFILIALGLVFLTITLLIATKLIPWIVREVSGLIRKLFSGRSNAV